MKDNIPPFPWEFKSVKFIGEESTRIMDCAGYYIAHEDGIRSLEERDKIASAIVSAVNATYGNGINPEVVPEFLRILQAYIDADDSHADVWIKMQRLKKEAKVAIEKAKLPL